MKKSFVVVVISLLIVAIVAGCGTSQQQDEPKKDAAQPGSQELSGSLTTAGSTSVQPLSEVLAQAFMGKHPKVSINVQGGGSSNGVKAAAEGAADIGASSRDLKEKEKGLGLVEQVICYDGIAIVANPQNSAVSDLTVEQVKKIFAGEITNWKEVGGNDVDIHVVTREEGSGTRGALEEIVMGEAKISDKAAVQSSNGAVRTTVAGDKDAIGYISMGYLDNTVKGIKIEGAEPTPENVVAGSYKIYRPFLYLTKGEPQGLAKEYLDFVKSEDGKKVIKEKGYIIK